MLRLVNPIYESLCSTQNSPKLRRQYPVREVLGSKLIGKAVFKRPLLPTISFLSCRIEGPVFDTGFSCGAPSAAAQGWHQVARHMHNPHGIIGARSASQLAPDSVAPMGNKCLCSSASLHRTAIKSTQCGPIFLYWTAFCPKAGHKKLSFKDFFSYENFFLSQTSNRRKQHKP